MRRRNDTYFMIVIENDKDTIVGVGTLLVEAKLYIIPEESYSNEVSTHAHWPAILKISPSRNQNKERSSALKSSIHSWISVRKSAVIKLPSSARITMSNSMNDVDLSRDKMRWSVLP